jgi:PhzF family phenazine biosynthesis protein
MPRFDRIEAACSRVDSTGLYPYAPSGANQFDARQFPRASGYPEDPATGVAATALAFGLLADGLAGAGDEPVVVRQGRAMGRPSRMTVAFESANGQVTGCWLGGPVELLT